MGPALKMKKKALKAAAVSGAYEGQVPFIIDVNMDFISDSAVDADINVKVASVRVTCPGEVYSSDGSLITFPNAPTDGDCLGDGVRSDGKDASKYNLNINVDGTLTFNSDGYPALKMKKKALRLLPSQEPTKARCLSSSMSTWTSPATLPLMLTSTSRLPPCVSHALVRCTLRMVL